MTILRDEDSFPTHTTMIAVKRCLSQIVTELLFDSSMMIMLIYTTAGLGRVNEFNILSPLLGPIL